MAGVCSVETKTYHYKDQFLFLSVNQGNKWFVYVLVGLLGFLNDITASSF